MSELLGLVSPEAVGRGERAKTLVLEICQLMGLDGLWWYELAAMLSQIDASPCLRWNSGAENERGSFFAGGSANFSHAPGHRRESAAQYPAPGERGRMVAGQELPLDKSPSLGARILKVASWTIRTNLPEAWKTR